MFLDGKGNKAGAWEDDQFRRDAELVSKFIIKAYSVVQQSRPPEIYAGPVTVRCIIAGTMFAVGVLIKNLPPRERKYLREYMVHKLDDMLKEHGAPG